MRRVAPHPRTRGLEVRGVGDRRLRARRLPVQRLALLPLQILCVHDVVAHGCRRYPPRVEESRPAALPPETRTVGQLVAESIRFYGDHFWPVLALGLPFLAI